MSSSFCWEPIKPKNHKTFGTALKFFCREWTERGIVEDLTVCESDIPYLRGAMQVANGDLKKELSELIEVVEKHKEIRLWEKF